MMHGKLAVEHPSFSNTVEIIFKVDNFEQHYIIQIKA